jgi:hypothetical protein
MLLLPLVGSGFMLSMSAANTILQTLTPDRLRGRVMSLFLMMFMGTPPLASLLSGVGASHLGAPLTVAITGACCLASSVWFALRMHVLENATGVDEEEPAEALREEAVVSKR